MLLSLAAFDKACVVSPFGIAAIARVIFSFLLLPTKNLII